MTCNHPERAQIESALRSGGTFRTVAHRFGMRDKTTLLRHADRCMAADMVLAEAARLAARTMGVDLPPELASKDGRERIEWLRDVVARMAVALEERVAVIVAAEDWTTTDDKGSESIRPEIVAFERWATLLRDTETKLADQALAARWVRLEEAKVALVVEAIEAALGFIPLTAEQRRQAIEAACEVLER